MRVLDSQENTAPRRYSALSNAAFVVSSIQEYDKALLAVACLHAVFSAAMRFVPILLPKYVIDAVSQGAAPGAVLRVALGFGLVLLIAESAGKVAHNHLQNRFIVVRLRLIARSGRKFMSADYEHLEDPEVLDLARRGDRACDNNANGVEGVMHRLLSIFGRAIVLAGSGAIIATLHPLMLAVIAGLLAVNFAVSSRARKADKAINDSLATTHRRLGYITGTMSDFAYGKEIRLFGMKRFLLSKYGEEQSRVLDGETAIQRIWLRSKNVFAATSFVQEGVMYAWLCRRVLSGAIGMGDFVMYVGAIRAFADVLNGIADDISHIRQQTEVISDFRAFLDLPGKAGGTGRLPEITPGLACEFTFENVSFRYPRSDRDALKGVSLTIRAGERLAIVGLNGAGKTTLVKLLTRLYDPGEGRILLNGVDIRTYDRRDYQRLFSVVFQDVHPFAFSVAENVSMRILEETDRDRVVAALEQAGLGSKLKALPKGIDTAVLKVIDEGGVEFSGGESQKLALARALYKNAPVVILDEPTAALDALAEAKLYADFDAMIGKRTAVYISHRLASTRFCDRVAVFEDGRIIETGTHEELMKRGGRYAELFSVQARYYHDGHRREGYHRDGVGTA